MTVTALPRPAAGTSAGTDRWRPTRAGLLNVWRYYDEVLEFAGGRLLLRGANGSGKSKALELLLPFLLDANLRAQRLSTFGTGERTMHWNLMGQGATGTTRVGFVWVEFGTDDGPGWFTAGARLQASTHSSQVHADYFTTDQRVGHDLALTTDTRTPLTRPQLDDALAGRGTRHENGHDHRRAVRQALFPGMSEQRYDALITALLQLRTPKLSQRLDPALLSTLLSRALPPLGEGEVGDLAEGFERLDRQREHLARLDAEAAAAHRLAEQQRSYARRVLRSRAAAVVRATSEMDGRTRTARLSEQRHAEALVERDAAEERSRELTERIETLDARLEALRDSDAYREGVLLEELRTRLDDTRRTLGVARAAREAATRLADDDTSKAEAAREQARAADALRSTRLEETRRAARDAGLATTVTQVEAGGGRGLLQGAVESRRHLIAEVRGHLDVWDRAVAVRTDREADLDQARAALAEATTARAAAEERAEKALTAQAFRLESWLRQTGELAGAGGLEAFTDAVLADVASEAAVVAAVEAAAAAVRRELDRAEVVATAERDRVADERQQVQDEHDRVAGQREIAPTPPPTRTADRAGRAGAPLWRLVAFADGVTERTTAAVEAALQAAGLLDAWVTPSGRLEGLDGHDTVLTALAPAPGPSMLEVVVPDPDAATVVDPAVLRRLLGSIAYTDDLDAHPAVISPTGGFRLASLVGTWAKDEPSTSAPGPGSGPASGASPSSSGSSPSSTGHWPRGTTSWPSSSATAECVAASTGERRPKPPSPRPCAPSQRTPSSTVCRPIARLSTSSRAPWTPSPTSPCSGWTPRPEPSTLGNALSRPARRHGVRPRPPSNGPARSRPRRARSAASLSGSRRCRPPLEPTTRRSSPRSRPPERRPVRFGARARRWRPAAASWKAGSVSSPPPARTTASVGTRPSPPETPQPRASGRCGISGCPPTRG